jgi:hypothetical protein
MSRIDRGKGAIGTAVKRNKPSQAAEVLVGQGLVHDRVVDCGCGFGFDADYSGWESCDPFYNLKELLGKDGTVICTLVMNALSPNNQAKAIENIRGLSATDGIGYLGVVQI